MSYKIELLAGENILLGRWNEDFVFQDEIEVYNRETLDLLNSLKTPVYFVHEFGNPGLSMQDIISGASIATKSEESTFRHKMIKQVIFITTNPALSIAAKGLNTVSFGNVDVRVFKTLDEAMNYVHSLAA